MDVDFCSEDEGDVVAFIPLTRAAHRWLAANKVKLHPTGRIMADHDDAERLSEAISRSGLSLHHSTVEAHFCFHRHGDDLFAIRPFNERAHDWLERWVTENSDVYLAHWEGPTLFVNRQTAHNLIAAMAVYRFLIHPRGGLSSFR